MDFCLFRANHLSECQKKSHTALIESQHKELDKKVFCLDEGNTTIDSSVQAIEKDLHEITNDFRSNTGSSLKSTKYPEAENKLQNETTTTPGENVALASNIRMDTTGRATVTSEKRVTFPKSIVSKMEKQLQPKTQAPDNLSSRQQSNGQTNTLLQGPLGQLTNQAATKKDDSICSEESSSRKTSSSSNGSSGTSGSSSSFSSHNLKTLPEPPYLVSNEKSTKVKGLNKPSGPMSDEKSLLWQDDPGQLLNAWLGELDSLQKVKV